MKLEEKLRQQQEAEQPIFKNVCPCCGGESCDCQVAIASKQRWDWYGESKNEHG